LWVVVLSVALVKVASLSLRGAARALQVVLTQLGLGRAPTAGTVRLWLLRVGLGQVRRPKAAAADWVWLMDHSTQVDDAKCFVVLGVRLSALSKKRLPLTYEDVEPFATTIMHVSDGPAVCNALEEISKRVGIVPTALLSDQGTDLRAGSDLFLQAHPGTRSLHDMAHRAAVELKTLLTQDPLWEAFCQQANLFKRQVQQTPLAALAPPAQRSKSRYMNLPTLIDWACRILTPAVFNAHKVAELLEVPTFLVVEKVAAFFPFVACIPLWSELSHVATVFRQVIGVEGYHAGAADQITDLLATPASGDAARLRERLLSFLSTQVSNLRPGECIPGSTEILESVFGRYKGIQGSHLRTGFQVGVLDISAITAPTEAACVATTLINVKTSDIRAWRQGEFGTTVAAQRRLIRMLEPVKKKLSEPRCAA
jgi:hypothetical protein